MSSRHTVTDPPEVRLRPVDDDAAEAVQEAGITPTGDDLADLVAALSALQDARDRAAKAREIGTPLVLALRTWGLSWRDMQAETGVDQTTLRRWAGDRS